MTDDPVEPRLDVVVHLAMEARGETVRSLTVNVLTVLAAAVAIFRSLPA